MTSTYKFKPYRMKTNKETQAEIDRIMKRVEKHGYAVTNQGKCSRMISANLQRKDLLLFAYDMRRRQSMIAINPDFKIKINKNKTISFIQRKD